MRKLLSLALSATMLLGTAAGPLIQDADAKRNCWRDKHGRVHCNNGRGFDNYRHYSRDRRYYYDDRRRAYFDTRTGKIIKGGLIGAGIGAGAGYVMDRPVGKSALVGAGVGAGVQATRYSNFMYRHPIVKTATYGALAGTAVGALRHLD